MGVNEHTERFRLGTGAFLTRLFYLHGTVPLVVILCMTAMAVVLSMAGDIRFVVIALMIVFIFAPAILAWLYVSKGMVSETTFNIAWHRLILTDRGISVEVLKPIYKSVEADSDEDNVNEKREKEVISSWITHKTIHFDFHMMKAPLAGGDGLTLPLRGERGFIAIPYTAFQTKERYDDFTGALNMLYENHTFSPNDSKHGDPSDDPKTEESIC